MYCAWLWLRRFWPALLLPLTIFMAFSTTLNRELFLLAHEASRIAPGAFWRLLSVLGDWPTVLASLLALSWKRPDKLPALLIACGAGIFFGVVLKAGFAHPRPPLVLAPGAVVLLDDLPSNGSFPSGHVMASATLASFLFYSALLRQGALLATVVALVMWSRLAIGVHWPLDVIAGAFLGWIVMFSACCWAWPQGWAARLTVRLQSMMLSGLLLYLLWLLYNPAAHEGYVVRSALCMFVLVAGCFRERRLRLA